MTRFALTATLVAILSFCSPIARSADPQRTHDIQPEDYFTIGVISSVAVSQDGTHIAYTEARWEESEDKRNTDIWVVNTDGQETTRLTFDPAHDSAIQWSPDGRHIYFTSSRKQGDKQPPFNGKKQIWRIRSDGSEMRAVTRLEQGIVAYQLARDGRSVYYTVTKEESGDDIFEKTRTKHKDLNYGHGVVEFHELWKLDLQSWRAKKIIDENRVINEFTVSDDEQRIAMQTTPDGELISNEGWSRIDVYNATAKTIVTLPDTTWRNDAPSPYGWLLGLTFSTDGNALSFRCDFDGYPGEVFVAHFDDTRHTSTQKISRPQEVYISGHTEWVPGTKDLCFTAHDHARVRIFRIRDIRDGMQGQSEILTPGDACVETFAFNSDGTSIAAVMSGLNHPPDIFTLPTSGRNPNVTRVTRVNPQVDTWKMPQIKTVKWTSPDGTTVEGILELPPDYDGTTKLPTIIELHGGPTSTSKLRFRFWIYGRVLFASRGWALLSPNYRGSTGYGDKFLTDLIGHKNDRDVADIMSGVDWMIDNNIADPDRMAVMGWSNGGYLTNCLITRTDRFKAASSGAGVFDTVMQWLAEDTPGHVINFNQGLPWTAEKSMRAGSPLYNVDKVKTPTIIHVGENDPRCPPAHSKGLYRALRHYLNVPTELVIYPGTGHSTTTYKHRKAKMDWDIAWFDHYVLNRETESEAPKSEKPVD